MFSKYIHTLKFSVGSQIYTATIEDDINSQEYLDVVKRVKEKIFKPVGISVIAVETREREDGSNRNEVGNIRVGTDVIPSKCVGCVNR